MSCNCTKIHSKQQNHCRSKKSVDKQCISVIIFREKLWKQDLQRDTDSIDHSRKNTDRIQFDISSSDQICHKYSANQTDKDRDNLAFLEFFPKHKPSKDCNPDWTHKHQYCRNPNRNSRYCHTIADKADTVGDCPIHDANNNPFQIDFKRCRLCDQKEYKIRRPRQSTSEERNLNIGKLVFREISHENPHNPPHNCSDHCQCNPFAALIHDLPLLLLRSLFALLLCDRLLHFLSMS